MTAPTTIHRTDPLPAFPNPSKDRAIRATLDAWRDAAEAVAADQWRRFFEKGRFEQNLPANAEAAVPAIRRAKQRIGAERLQMVRYQVVGTLRSFLANRQNDFRRCVERSSLDDATKHQLHTVNRRQAWFDPRDVAMPDGTAVLADARKLGRRIMRHVLSRHRRPSFKNANMVVDQRQAVLGRAQTATTYDYWLRLGTVDQGKVNVPLRSYPYHEAREGSRCQTVQVNTDRDGRLSVGVVTDVTGPFR